MASSGPAMMEFIRKDEDRPLRLIWVLDPFVDGMSHGWAIARLRSRPSLHQAPQTIFRVGRIFKRKPDVTFGFASGRGVEWRVRFNGKRPILVPLDDDHDDAGPTTLHAQMAIEIMWPRYVELLKKTKNMPIVKPGVRVIDPSVNW